MGTPLSRASLVLTLVLVGGFVLFTPPLTADGFTATRDFSVMDSTAAPVMLSLGNVNLGVAAFDARSGKGYIMYSEESVHTRFASTPPSQWNADHLIAVVYLDEQWFIDNNAFALVPFTPRASDRLLVEVDFGANTATTLEGINTTTNTITTGYISADLLVTPEVWGGDPDEGEFWIQGTEVIVEGSTPTVEIIDGPPADSIITNNDPLFAWTGSDLDGSIANFFIDLSGPSPDSLTLTDTLYQFSDLSNGDYTFCVTAQDNNNNSSSAACRSFSVNFTPPNELPTIQITSGPEDNGIIDFANPLFAWSAEDADGTVDSFFVALSGPTADSLSTTESSIQFEELLNGDYLFCVQAQDNAGELSDAACRSFTVVVIPPNELPTVQLIEGPEEGSIIDFANPAFAWIGEDTDGAIDSFFVNLEGPTSDSIATTDSSITYEALTEGGYSFCVQASDSDGGLSESACRSFTVLFNVAPTVQITNGPADSSVITYSNPAFTWEGEDVDGTINSFLVSLEGPSPDSFATTNTFIQYAARENGDYSFCVQAFDDDDAASDSTCRFFSIDVQSQNIAPVVAINNGPEEGSTIDYNNPAFSWSGEDTDGEIDSFHVELRGPSFAAFSTQDTFHQFSNLLNGDHEFCIRALDIEGLFSSWECRLFSVFIPTSNLPPTVTIENGPAEGDSLLFNNPAFSWAGEDIDGTVDSFLVALQGPTPVEFATTATFEQFSALDNGDYSFCIQAMDDLGALSEQLCRSFVLIADTQNEIPTVTIENGPEEGSTITFNNPAFSWIGEDADGMIEAYNVDLIGPTPISFSTSDTFFQFPPLASGTYSFCIQAMDDNSALSSWVCRQFDVNSALSGTLKDLVISKDGAILQIPLVQEPIKIYQSDVFIESTSTDGQGGFSIQGQYGQGNYQLVTEFTEAIEGVEDPVAIQHTLPIIDSEALEILVPKSLAVDQFEILSSLSNFSISTDLLEGEPGNVSTGPLYNLEQLDSQLRAWLSSLTSNNDQVINTMQRTYLATALMERLLDEAIYMSHEQAETLFNVLEVYLTSHEFLSLSRAQLTDTADPNLESALHAVLLYVDSLIYEMTVNTPVKYATAFTPAPYHRSYLRASLLMFDSILEDAVFDPGLGTRFSREYTNQTDRDRFKIEANQSLLEDLYIPETQPFIQTIADRSSLLNVQGTFSDAFEELLSSTSPSVSSQSQDLTRQAVQQSDSLQLAAGSILAAQQIAVLISSQASYTSLNSVSNIVLSTSFDQSAKALIYTGSGISKLHEYGQAGAIKSFHPDSLISNQVAVQHTEPLEPEVESILSLDEQDYLTQLDEAVWFAQQGQRNVVISLLDDLVEFDRQYESFVSAFQGDVWAAAEQVVGSNPSLKATYESLLEARITTLQHRIKMYIDLLRYAGLQPVAPTDLASQRDSVAQSLINTSLLAQQIKLNLSGLNEAAIAIHAHYPASQEVAPGSLTEFIVTVGNTGRQPANNLTLTLSADSLFSFVSPPTYIIPTLDPDQEITIRWEFVIPEHVHSGGLYVIEAKGPGIKEVYSSGTYKVGIEREITTSNENAADIPLVHALHPNYPNPFNSETTIRYDLPDQDEVTLTLYDMVGREIRTLVSTSMPAGKHSVRLDSQGLPSGAYILRLAAGNYVNTQSIVVVQ